ncbi:chemotaxis protein CheD [Paracidovorax avenae]|uniref:chemotaxis protein CheD n=1 Tax=Paracidovorax avenae TaxID=80867 RepID=UPI001CEF880D|nr:chemotaxis protein CheD [Paracidovorax avenae]
MPTSFRPMDVFLQPGEYFVGDDTMRLRTMLGSCVAITLWHPARRIGAMSHFLLADRGRPARPGELDGRYGDEALELMVRGLRRQRVSIAECEAKIFGGGNMFPTRPRPAMDSVGTRNGHAARQLLAGRGIGVRSEHLFGDGHRQVVFDVASGAVWVRQVPPAAPRQP